MKLREIACVHKNMPWADFWIIPAGEKVGMPTKEFDRDYIGVMFMADAVFKKGVMPNKFLTWWKVIYHHSGAMVQILKLKINGTKEVSEDLMKDLKLPDRSVPNETTS